MVGNEELEELKKEEDWLCWLGTNSQVNEIDFANQTTKD